MYHKIFFKDNSKMKTTTQMNNKENFNEDYVNYMRKLKKNKYPNKFDNYSYIY